MAALACGVSACSGAPIGVFSVWDFDRANAECHRLGTGSSHPEYHACLAQFGATLPPSARWSGPIDGASVAASQSANEPRPKVVALDPKSITPAGCDTGLVWRESLFRDQPDYIVWQHFRYDDCSESMEIYVNATFDDQLTEDIRWAIVEAARHGWSDESFQIWFNSGGGSVRSGIEIAMIINDFRVSTGIYDGDVCASACSIAFMAGNYRYMLGDAQLGIHSAYDENGDISEDANALLSVSAFLIGGDEQGIYRKLAVSTEPGDMFWLNREQATAFNLAGDRRQRWVSN